MSRGMVQPKLPPASTSSGRSFDRRPRALRVSLSFLLTILTALLSIHLASPRPSPRPPTTWVAGVSKLDITPAVPIFLSGFASRTREPSLDEVASSAKALFVRSLSVRESATAPPLVFVALDLIGGDGVFSDAVFRALKDELGLRRASVKLCFSHTHSGPVVGRNLFPLAPEDDAHLRKVAAYAEWLRGRIVASVAEAVEGGVEAHGRFGFVESAIAVNRREVPEAAFDGNWRGETEGRVSVLWFENVGGASRVVGGVYGVAAHASVITKGYEYSGDYPGFASGMLERDGEGGVGGVWLFAAGAGGDQNVYPRGAAADAKRHGVALAGQVCYTVQTDRGRLLEAEVGRSSGKNASAAVHELVPLPFRSVLSRAILRKMARRRSPESATSKRMAAHWLKVLATGQQGSDVSTEKTPSVYSRFPLTVWRIGQVRIAFLGGEPTVGYSAAIRGASTIDWVIGYADDVMGYVGTSSVLSDGSREGSERVAVYYGLPSAWDESIEGLILSICARLASALE